MQCQDFNGCAQCRQHYNRLFDALTGIWYCQQKPPQPPPTGYPTKSPVDPPATTCTDGIAQCSSTNCAGEGDNVYCLDQYSWGCSKCQDGYFHKSYQYPCVSCDTLDGCLSCGNWQGCVQCDTGYSWYWDSLCGIGRCQA